MAVIAAVTNYAEFRDNILTEDEKKTLKTEKGAETAVIDSTPVYFVNQKDYVVVTPSKDVAAVFEQKATRAPRLDGKLSKAQAAQFLASDVGLYVNMEDVNTKYADQIKAAHKAVDDQIEQLESALAPRRRPSSRRSRR